MHTVITVLVTIHSLILIGPGIHSPEPEIFPNLLNHFRYAYIYFWRSNNSIFFHQICGYIRNPDKALHTGWLVSIGVFSLTGNESDFSLNKIHDPGVSISGMVLSPQAFAELNITKWMRMRTGLSYNFYSFEDQSIVRKSDLQSISFTLGLVFSNFN
jgi:hypothetical protein